MHQSLIRALGLVFLLAFLPPVARAALAKPNLVYILCDDLGYGDVHCFNPASKIPTPHLDRLAAQGMVFTDAHSSSSVCTPTRYGILTGRYNWRSRLKQGVLGGLSPPLIEPDRLTVASFLRQHGYQTAAIGKWHLGLGWARTGKGEVSELSIETRAHVLNVDYAQPIRHGPLALGFDYFFGIAASLDMVPYTFIENDRVTALPTEDRQLVMMAGRESGFTRQGPAAPGFTGQAVLPAFTQQAVAYVAQQAPAARAHRPFFLYLALTAPHTPILPTPDWSGRSLLNSYADFVMQTDAAIGEVITAIDQQGLAPNTLLIVTSDNGCSPMARFDELEARGHRPSGGYRGHKADIFEGGHRIPFVVRWPDRVPAGSRSAQTICLTDFLATVADVLRVKLPPDAGEDSVSLLPALLGKDRKPMREAIVHHSINGAFAIREGHWKLCLTPSSGGWSAPRPNSPEAATLPPVQLYDLRADPGERTNLQAEHPEVVTRLKKLLDQYVSRGRSTPGRSQPNTMPVDILAGGT
jgi:arylsulfatase A-like enzyme